MQDIVVGAFRKRLSKRGYSYISIKRIRGPFIKDERYIVSAREPLAYELVSVELTIEAMYHMFR